MTVSDCENATYMYFWFDKIEYRKRYMCKNFEKLRQLLLGIGANIRYNKLE